MAKYRVYLSGTLDYDYEVEAADEYIAEDLAVALFEQDYPTMWSGINVYEIEELDDES